MSIKSGIQTKIELKHQQSESDEEEIIVKNLDSGETQSGNSLTKNHSSILINQEKSNQIWKNYWNQYSKLGDRLLSLVVKKNLKELIKVVTEFPIDLNKYSYMDGWTLLHYAVSQNQPSIIQLLIQFGMNIDTQTNTMHRTPLHQATLSNKLHIVKILIKYGANPNIMDSDRNTSIHFAVDFGYLEIVQAILESSITIDLEARNCMNMNPFNTCRNSQIFQILIDYSTKSQMLKSKDSRSTSAKQQNNKYKYQSRLVMMNSDVIPQKSRVDQVEKFLSLRENQEKKKIFNDSTISEESMEESILSQEESPKLTAGKSKLSKPLKRVGSYLKNSSLMKSSRIASQNIGLIRQSLFKSYYDHQEHIGNYDKMRKLGEGSFAEVFLVRKKHSSKLFAMKKLDKKLIIQHKLEQYVFAQKKVLTTIKHPFIIETYNCLQDFTHLYFISQFCQGGDLQKIIRKQVLNETIAKTYTCEIALAIDHLHKNNFLYRDLKLSNTLLDKYGHIKLSDFGLAKQASHSQSFVGSNCYLAPQMLIQNAEKPHNRSLDWYLLGIFIYQLIHGFPPFYNKDPEIMKQKILNQEPEYLPSLSITCKEVLNRLLQKNPQKRLSKLEQFIKLSWFQDISWDQIFNKKGQTIILPEIDYKDLRSKQIIEDEESDCIIDPKIEWIKDWNWSNKK